MGRVNLIIAALLMLSAISLVTSRYQSRQLFVELGRDQAQERDLEVGWRRLQLERAELARNARVDAIARDSLKMISIVPDRTLYLNQAPATGGANEARPILRQSVLRGRLPTWRARLVLILLFGGFTVLAGRALFLQAVDRIPAAAGRAPL